MQLTMKQTELEVAVKEYVQNQGITRGVDHIDFSATRGGDGIVVTIDFADTVATPPGPVTRIRSAGPAEEGTSALAEEEISDAGEAESPSDTEDGEKAGEAGNDTSLFG